MQLVCITRSKVAILRYLSSNLLGEKNKIVRGEIPANPQKAFVSLVTSQHWMETICGLGSDSEKKFATISKGAREKSIASASGPAANFPPWTTPIQALCCRDTAECKARVTNQSAAATKVVPSIRYALPHHDRR